MENQGSQHFVGIKSIHHALKLVESRHSRKILSYFQHVEHLLEMYFDTSQVWHIWAAVDLVDAKTFTIPPSNVYGPTISNFYGAYACCMNMFLQARKDNDFTYSAVFPHMRSPYLLNDCPIVHFLYPRLGIEIPRRLGDVSFFNPKEPHYISSRSHKEDNFYCLSLFLKSTNLGLNNNSIPLTPSQASLSVEYNVFHTK